MKLLQSLLQKALTISLILAALSAHAQEIKILSYPDEKHFKNMQQLTTGGDNAEAYFGFDNEHITFQRTNLKEGLQCD
jgi:TolB protein